MKATHQHFCMVFVAVTLVAAGATSQALGVTYNLIDLTPSGSSRSGALAVGGGQQGGYATVSGYRHAFLWSGSAASGVDLHTGGYNESHITGISGTQQAGYIHGLGTGDYHAYIWSGNPASGVDLHPSGYSASCITGTNGTQQVGCGGDFMIDTEDNIVIGFLGTHALLWNGSPTNYVDLNPSRFRNSVATGISGTQQVGWGDDHALLWSGSPGSYVDLHPSGFTSSKAYGISGSQQVGSGRTGRGNEHALLWNGSPGSYLDLNPSGYGDSRINGTNGEQQVGWGKTGVPPYGYLMRALLWNGSATDFVALPVGGFYETWATGIDDYGNIVGVGKTFTGPTHALLWQPIPEPATVSLLAMGELAMLGRRRKETKNSKF